jgi:4-oxalocrotonate tautomerase
MPLVQISMWAGRTAAQKKRIIEEVTKVLCKTLDLKPDTVTVIIYDVEKINWGKEGEPCAETK